MKLLELENQLETYFIDMYSSSEFSRVIDIDDLEKNNSWDKKHTLIHIIYPLVYLFVTLVVNLFIAWEVFFYYKYQEKLIAKLHRRSMNGCNYYFGEGVFYYEYGEESNAKLNGKSMDEWRLAFIYIEIYLFDIIDNEIIIQCFEKMKIYHWKW